MSATIIKAVWGIPEHQKPIAGMPSSRVKIRFRNGDFARGWVRTANGVKSFVLRDNGDAWEPIWQSENKTIQP